MSLRTILLGAMAASSATAVKLLVSNYGPTSDTNLNGTVVTLDYTNGTLQLVHANADAGRQPTWIDRGLLGKAVVLDESWATSPNNSGLYTFDVATDGELTKSEFLNITRGGPVATQFYNEYKNMAVAHYGGQGITTFKNDNGVFTLLQNIGYEDRVPGPKPQQADGSHVHHAVIDPTGAYVMFPDLGLDTHHIFCVDPDTGNLVEHGELKAPTGYGPRHATFWNSSTGTVYYIAVHEISNKIISYAVTYEGGLNFTQVDEVSTYGPNADPAITQFGAAAEIVVSPDRNFILASNRNVTFSQVPNADPKNATEIDSNSIVTYKLGKDGKLHFADLAPSGGLFPRHFELNRKGDMIAIANQNSRNVRIYKRHVKSGRILNELAGINMPGSPNNVRWL